MRKLQVDFQDLSMAMEDQNPDMEWYLDLETGEVFFIGNELITGEDDSELAEKIEENPSRYAAVPTVDSHDGYRDMVRFAETVKDPRLQRELDIALNGRGAFRRFRDVLLDYPSERERWFRFSEQQMERRIREWFECDLKIEPVLKRRIP